MSAQLFLGLSPGFGVHPGAAAIEVEMFGEGRCWARQTHQLSIFSRQTECNRFYLVCRRLAPRRVHSVPRSSRQSSATCTWTSDSTLLCYWANPQPRGRKNEKEDTIGPNGVHIGDPSEWGRQTHEVCADPCPIGISICAASVHSSGNSLYWRM